MKTEPLLRLKELCEQLPCCPGYVYAMKGEGFAFSHGNRTTLSAAREWLAAHPDFRSTPYFQASRRRRKGESELEKAV